MSKHKAKRHEHKPPPDRREVVPTPPPPSLSSTVAVAPEASVELDWRTLWAPVYLPAYAALVHPLTRLLAVVLAAGAGLRWLFFQFSEKIWALHETISLEAITPWTRGFIENDGAEPQVLLFLLLLLAAITGPAMFLLDKIPTWICAIVVVLCLVVGVGFALVVPPSVPMAGVASSWDQIERVEAGVLLAGVLALWAGRRRATYLVIAALLVPVCFLQVGPYSLIDLSTVLAPALRLRHGFRPHEIYLLYDLLPSLLAVGWHWLGFGPMTFPFVTRVTFYVLLLGCFLVARRLFEKRSLAALLLIALCAVRLYAVYVEANGNPQVTPLRLDLWIVLVAVTLFFGLRHWSVGLALGLIFFFARSFGTLYLASYGLALAADFLAERAAANQWQWPGVWRDFAAYMRGAILPWILAAAGVLAATYVFGSIVSREALAHRRIGVGMLRVSQDSFYWWIAPMVAAVAWLAFSLWSALPRKRAQAALFLIALAMCNLVYFFGRSHEHNLINISASLVFCLFLGIDLAAVMLRGEPGWAGRLVQAAPWLVLALITYGYSGRIYGKVLTQVATAPWNGAKVPVEDSGPLRCEEVAAAVGNDRRIFFFGGYDYWFYEKCGYVPQGYVHPLGLQVMKPPLVEELSQLLRQGYKIVLPKSQGVLDFGDFIPNLPPMWKTETPDYFIYGKNGM